MSAFSRNKGKRGEREVAGLIRELLGVDASRRVRQHDGDSDRHRPRFTCRACRAMSRPC